MNWGTYNGGFNGWYIDTWVAGENNYNSDKRIVYNIKP